jgi:small-conductance mechanosensitive channel
MNERLLGKALGLAVLVGVSFASLASGQIPGISSSKTPPPAASPAAETPEETEARLQLWLKETRGALAKINEPDAEANLPVGVTGQAFADYRRDLDQIVIWIARHQKILSTAPVEQKALEDAHTAAAAWTGFQEKPPYSILFVDELENQQVAMREKLSSSRSSLALMERSLATILDEGKQAAEVMQRLLTEAEAKGEAGVAAKWRLSAHRTKTRLLAMRNSYLRANAKVLQDRVETGEIELALLDRQVATAKKSAFFTDEDLSKVQKAADDRRAAIRKEIVATRKRQQDAIKERDRTQAQVNQLLEAAEQSGETVESEALSIAKLELESEETLVESLQFVVERLEFMDQLEPDFPLAYRDRKVLMDAPPTALDLREDALRSMRTASERLKSWSVLVINDLSNINADIGKQESRAAIMDSEDPRLVPINTRRAALWEKQAVSQRLSQAVASQRRMIRRWLDEFDPDDKPELRAASLAGATTSVWNSMLKIWNFPVFHYDDTVIIGGLTSTEKRGVPLGKFFIAILFFTTAYLIASRIKSRLQRMVVRRGRIAEAQANTLSNWMMIVVGVLLALTTLHFLRIPLTVFAFFGGALAIGLGFGSQTLIKNFISGIIVLFERKIRVGDIVDVGGFQGAIVEINTRSSVLSSADGRETLVPNSVFLETSITNLTLATRVVRRFVNVGVAYGSSVSRVKEILADCAARHGLVCKDPEPLVIFQDFGDNALIFKLYFWFEMGQGNPEQVESDVRGMIEKSFAEAGIEFPFPQRDLHLTTKDPLKISMVPEHSESP